MTGRSSFALATMRRQQIQIVQLNEVVHPLAQRNEDVFRAQ